MPAVYPAFFFVPEKGSKSAGNAVIPTYPMHRSHGLQDLRHKRPTFAFTSESGTHSAFGEESHTAAHTAKHGPSGRGRYHYPRHVLHVHEHPQAGCQNGVLCRFGILARRCSRRTQKAFGTAMRLCVSLSRGVAAPLGCVIFFASAEVAACTPCAQCFPNVRDEG